MTRNLAGDRDQDFITSISHNLADADEVVWDRKELLWFLRLAVGDLMASKEVRGALLAARLPIRDSKVGEESVIITKPMRVTDSHGTLLKLVVEGYPLRGGGCGEIVYATRVGEFEMMLRPAIDFDREYYLEAEGVDLKNPPPSIAAAMAAYARAQAFAKDSEVSEVARAAAVFHRDLYSRHKSALPRKKGG